MENGFLCLNTSITAERTKRKTPASHSPPSPPLTETREESVRANSFKGDGSIPRPEITPTVVAATPKTRMINAKISENLPFFMVFSTLSSLQYSFWPSPLELIQEESMH